MNKPIEIAWEETIEGYANLTLAPDVVMTCEEIEDKLNAGTICIDGDRIEDSDGKLIGTLSEIAEDEGGKEEFAVIQD